MTNKTNYKGDKKMDGLDLVIPTVESSGNAATMQLPDIDLYNYWNLYNNRILTVDGEITDWDYSVVKSILQINMADRKIDVKDRKPIILLVNSPGGLLDVTNSIIDAVSISTTPVWTVNMGSALSGGCLVYLAGERRFATTNSWAMTHSGSGSTSGTYDESVEQKKVWDEQVKNMGAYIVGRTGIDEKLWNKNKKKDWWLDCEKQLELGFATDKLESLDQILRVER